MSGIQTDVEHRRKIIENEAKALENEAKEAEKERKREVRRLQKIQAAKNRWEKFNEQRDYYLLTDDNSDSIDSLKYEVGRLKEEVNNIKMQLGMNEVKPGPLDYTPGIIQESQPSFTQPIAPLNGTFYAEPMHFNSFDPNYSGTGELVGNADEMVREIKREQKKRLRKEL